jgi:putative spermidine/putrescine transport system permease protein
MKPSLRSRLLLFASAWLVGLFLLLPGLITIPVSLNDSRFIAMPKDGLSLRHFEALFSGAGWLDSMGQSAVIAIVVTVASVLIGTACAIGLWRLAGPLAVLVSALVLTPMILPAIVSGLALYRMWVALGLYDSWLGVIIAHTILAVPFVVITVTTSLSMIDSRLEQASRSLGASPRMTALRVILPNIRGGVFTGAVFAFITSWDEIVVTLFVSGRGVYTLPRRMWDGIRENIDPTVTAVATVLIAATTIVVAGALLQAFRRPPGTAQGSR